MADEEKILQIIPAAGWYATYKSDPENTPLDPIVCFALVEMQQNGETWQEVRPMGTNGKLIELVDSADNFDTVVYKPTYSSSDA